MRDALRSRGFKKIRRWKTRRLLHLRLEKEREIIKRVRCGLIIKLFLRRS